MNVVVPLLIALCTAPAVALAGALRAAWAPRIAVVLTALAFGATLWGWLDGGGGVNYAWAPTLNLQLAFTLDGLAALYALLATGVGLLVLIYSSGYIPRHLHHQQRPAQDGVRFYALLTLFMAAMVGLAMAQDLVLLILFWDVTTLTSYFLIGYDRHDADARFSALMALIVTGVAAFCLILGALILYAQYGTFSVLELSAQAQPGPTLTVAGALIALAALAKSAQVPFHFWLPRAMAAPTPVSSYLHSAAMVAAGVLLLERTYPLLEQSALLLDLLLVAGFGSMLIGGVLALTRDVLKQVLAYSTVAQYGYMVAMLGLGGTTGVEAALFYVIAHALVKSALFMTAGAVTEATEKDRLSEVGGLLRRMPFLAVGSGVAAAGLAALPLTIGFFKDELFFEAALHHGWPVVALAVTGAAVTVGYMWHFWGGIFLGAPRAEVQAIPSTLVAPVVLLGLLVLVGGVLVTPFAQLAAAASASVLGKSVSLDLAYHLDARPTNLMALAAWAGGAAIILSRGLWQGAALALSRLGERGGPERIYNVSLAQLNQFSRRTLTFELRDLRDRVATILVPAAVLLALGIIFTPIGSMTYVFGTIGLRDLPLALSLCLVAVATLAAVRPKRVLTIVLGLSGVGYSLAAVYAFFGAPDVALVAVLVETVLTLLLLGMLTLFPHDVIRRVERLHTKQRSRWRDPLVGVVTGIGAFMVVWSTLSRHAAEQTVAVRQIAQTPAAHAGDVVTAILSDFRGLDTVGEISVIGITLLGVVALLRERNAS